MSREASSPDNAVALRELGVRVIRTLRQRNFIAYFAGGCVRDELLGITPADYDVATDATPDTLRDIFPRTSEVGASFGVVLVREHRLSIEVATFRSDGPYSDRRRPDHIRFSDPKSDALRRDFTINAMFLDPLADSSHALIDYVGGRADLESRVVRAVGDADARLREDHLRALRAVRFAARLGFAIEPGTAAAITRHAAELSGVSRERIGDELRRMLAHPSRADACRLLNDLRLDAAALDEPWRAIAPAIVSLLPADAGAMLTLAAWMLDRISSGDEVTSITPTRMHDALQAARRARRALCLSNEESAELVGVLENTRLALVEWGTAGVAARKRLAARRYFPEATILLSVVHPALARVVRTDIAALAADGVGLQPAPLVSGDDLIAAGRIPNPQFKGVLDSVYDAQLEGRIRTKAEALELAQRLRV